MESAKGQIRRTIFAKVRQRSLQADVEYILSVSVRRFPPKIVVIAVKIAVKIIIGWQLVSNFTTLNH